MVDASGNLYGTTEYGGTSSNCGSGGSSGCGAVFELANSSGSYTEKLLYSFTRVAGDGYQPDGALVMDASGNLFGTTLYGGPSNSGTVFELVNSSGSYTYNLLYTFNGYPNDGAHPFAGLVMDASGNLYGTTNQGGGSNTGTVFELVNSAGSYTENVLYSFAAVPDGATPRGGLVLDASGNLYGTTQFGGASNIGTVFELVNSSGSYTEKVLHGFSLTGADGNGPWAGLVMDASGNLYGTTSLGGATGNGTVFELVNSAGSYLEKVLYSFTSVPDGYYPLAGLIMDASGNLYGTTDKGGDPNFNFGTVFEVNPNPAPTVAFSSTSLDFGSELVGATTAEKTVTVTNSGTPDLTFAAGAVAISGANAGDFAVSTDTCSGQAVAANATCSVGVTFTPSAAGNETASLDFSDNAAGSPQSVGLSGTGVLPTVTVSPTSLTFPSTVTGVVSAAQSVTLSNTGSVDLTITGISTNLADYSQTNGCGTTLASGSSCTISVTFTPSSTGPIAGTLTIDDNATGSPQIVTLTGTGADFALSATTPTASISPGGTATFDLQVAPKGGFTGTVALACTGAPAHSTCTITPSSVSLDGTDKATATVSVATQAPSETAPLGPISPGVPPLALWMALAGLAGLSMLARFGPQRVRVRFGVLAPLAVLLMSLAFAASCGGGGSSKTPVNPGTPAGTYALTITGTSGSLNQTASLSLTIQ